MPETSAGLAAVQPIETRKSRGPEDGRLVTNVPACYGAYICEEADELGISPSTVVRMLLVEAIKARGFTKTDLEAKYPGAMKRPLDRRRGNKPPAQATKTS